MILRFFRSKLFLLFAFLLFVGFIIGYDFAVITSKEPPAATVKAPVLAPEFKDNLQEESGTDAKQ